MTDAPPFTDGPACYAAVARLLRLGADTPGHGFRLPTLATVGPGGSPEARVVVLRAFDAGGRTLTFHTDVRSPKVAELRADPRAVLVFYDPATPCQVRARVRAEVHLGDDVTRRLWDVAPPETRTGYAAAYAPGEVVAGDEPLAADDARGFENFCAVVCRFDELDVLVLRPDGNRRGRLTWDGGEVRLVRLAP